MFFPLDNAALCTMQDQSDHRGRFAGVQAADWVMKHLEWFSPNCAARFMEMVTPTRLVVYGTPSLQVKDALAAFSTVYIVAFGSFSR